MAGLRAEDVQQVVLGKPPIGQRGYAEDAVVEFPDRLAESLPGAGRATGIELNGAPLDR